MPLIFKSIYKRASKISLRGKSGQYYPCSTERILQLALDGQLSDAQLSNFFTADSLEAFRKPKTKAKTKTPPSQD